jgi:hypothetical protein
MEEEAFILDLTCGFEGNKETSKDEWLVFEG